MEPVDGEDIASRILPIPCACGSTIHIRKSRVYRKRIVMICGNLRCKRFGYGETVVEAVNNYEKSVVQGAKAS